MGMDDDDIHRPVLTPNISYGQMQESDTSQSRISSPQEFEDTLSNATGSVTLSASTGNSIITKLYKKRYFILIIFILYSASNAFQWIEYAIISNIISEYYKVSNFWINSTSVVYMVSYIIGIIPASWLLERKGLRYCVLLGSFGTCIGSWVKTLSVNRDRFYVTMIGQTIVAFSQLFILNIPPLLAAVWFSDREVSRATAYGVFGNQLGIALGFFLPSMIVPQFHNGTNHDNSTDVVSINNNTINNNTIVGFEEVSEGLKHLFLSVAIFTTILFIIIALLFSARPKYPPSAAQAHAQIMSETASFKDSLRGLIYNKNFVFLFFTYGLNAGVFYAVSTIMNQMITSVFGTESEKDTGTMGFIMTIAGIAGSIVCGYILDWNHRYKETTLSVYASTFFGMILFTGALNLPTIWPLFVVSAILGFFMTGYLPIGFEFAAEISYPQPEGTSAGLLNTSAQIFGIIFTFGGSAIVENFGIFPTNICFLIALALGILMTSLIKADLRRQNAAHMTAEKCVDINGTKLMRTFN